jgi:hypothetical protein
MCGDDGRTLLLARLEEAEVRLGQLAAAPKPHGRSDPDPGSEERWDAGQVWAHLAEFPPYWLAQAERIIEAPPDQPARIGRATSAPERVEPIEAGRDRPVAESWAACRLGIERVRAFALEASESDWARQGEHPVRGPVTAGFVLEAFVGGHLLEHAEQLERLATTSGSVRA